MNSKIIFTKFAVSVAAEFPSNSVDDITLMSCSKLGKTRNRQHLRMNWNLEDPGHTSSNETWVFSGPLWRHMSGRVFQVWVFHFLSWKFQLQGTFVTGFFISRKQSFTMSISEHHQQKGWTHTRTPLFGVSKRLMSSIHHEACRTNTTQKHEVCAISSFTANLETNTKKHKK